jgi:hypothetical protein
MSGIWYSLNVIFMGVILEIEEVEIKSNEIEEYLNAEFGQRAVDQLQLMHVFI